MVFMQFNEFCQNDKNNKIKRVINKCNQNQRSHHMFDKIGNYYLFAFGKYSFKTLNDINLINKDTFESFSILNNELIVSEFNLK